MSFHNTGLGLGLGLGLVGFHDHQSENSIESHKKKVENPSKCNKEYPSLTLGPPDDDEVNNQPSSKTESYEYFRPQVSSPSAVSSFSNSSSIKRERDQALGEEFEVEVEKVPTRVADVDEDGNPRKKLRLTKEQSAILEENFREHSTLNPKQKQELAVKLNLRTRQVEVWFQNRRARTKLKQTESDCELLKKCCDTLTDENKRLQKEVQELKSMQTRAVPLYMQIPAATLSICPSCERMCSGNNDNNDNDSSHTTTLFIGSNNHHNHFYKSSYPFSHSSSAAC
ncbi:homeobox-leucine zipper protein HAT9 [Cajanus cajan]|uniref:Homeobox-leucine zipper protein HOX19 n=1 Tax=Cajanus cajan TaxID=3821 RepID=A0A151T0N9_CAJCA|nr:homeobox-leucine zipper protein HAT9 [Cajanus cajan]KYP60615.1 Homeobox-leucine zipper protein HOX19 [Cajanus cajan]